MVEATHEKRRSVSPAMRTGWGDIVNLTIVILVCVTMLYPFLYLLLISVSPVEQVAQGGLLIIPKRIDLESFRYVLRASGIGKAYGVTIAVTAAGTALSLFLTSLGAYVLANRRLPGVEAMNVFLIITMIFNGGMIPTYIVVKTLGMIDTLYALFVPTALNTFWLFVMRNFVRGIPETLLESARLDGCGEFGIFVRIVLPVSGAIIASLTLFYGVGYWNQYFNAIMYINSTGKQSLQVLIRSMYQSNTSMSGSVVMSDTLPPPVESVRAATIILATAPILCVYPFLQKYFTKGIMVGAIKG